MVHCVTKRNLHAWIRKRTHTHMNDKNTDAHRSEKMLPFHSTTTNTQHACLPASLQQQQQKDERPTLKNSRTTNRKNAVVKQWQFLSDSLSVVWCAWHERGALAHGLSLVVPCV